MQIVHRIHHAMVAKTRFTWWFPGCYSITSTMERTAPPFPTPDHNHGACLADTLARARNAFEASGLRFTDVRLRVLTQIAASHHAIGAYDVIEKLSRDGVRLAPISVYRAIEALMAAGVVHRLESANAYFACHATHASARAHVVLACGACKSVAEIPAEGVFRALDGLAAAAAFEPTRRVVELQGRCAHCRDASGTGGHA
jgi:Fur family transcriptional regulator, zinc uptake regulator